MKANDEKLLTNKVTGAAFTAEEIMEMVDAVNKIFQCDTAKQLALGVNSENNYGTKTGFNLDGSAVAGGGEQIAIGENCKGYGWRAVSIGGKTIAGATSSTAIGAGTVCEKVHGVAIGRGAYTRTSNDGSAGSPSVVIGSVGANGLQMGNSWAHRHRMPKSQIGNGDNATPSNSETVFHGVDAYDDRDELYDAGRTYGVHEQCLVSDGGMTYTSLVNGNLGNALTDATKWEELATGAAVKGDYNVAGGHGAITGGRGTGTGAGGEVRFYTAPAANLGQNTKSPQVLAGKFDAAPGVDSRFLLLDVTDGTYKRVEFGLDDSAGAGYKTLKVAN